MVTANDTRNIGFRHALASAPGTVMRTVIGFGPGQWFQLAVLVLLGTMFALWLRPVPFSDWEYYWLAAGEPRVYLRGGVVLWLLAIPKAFGLLAWQSALLINVPAMLWTWWMAQHVDRTRYRLFALLVWAYLVLLTPYLAVVQLDLVATSLLASAFWLLLADRKSRGRYFVAALFIACAVSTRTQFALVLWSLVGLGGIAWLLLKRRPPAMLQTLAILFVGALLGFGLDAGMRHVSGRSQEVRVNLAVTIYSGLLVSSDVRSEGCGLWSPAAAKAAAADAHKSLSAAIIERLAAKQPSHWAGVLACKSEELIQPSPYAMYWLTAAPNVVARVEASGMDSPLRGRLERLTRIESKVYGPVRNMILVACFLAAGVSFRRAGALALLPVLWLASFWAVHSVFEIQGRYFLGMLLIAPILCALVWQRDTPRAVSGPDVPD